MVGRELAAARRRRYLSLDDFGQAARRRLPKMLHGFVADGAETNASLRANRAAFDDFSFLPRVLCDTSGRSQEVTLFGRTYAHPFGISPMGLVGMCAFEGDLALARAAEAARIPFVLSATSLVPLEEVREKAPGCWMQTYLPGEPERIAPFVARAAKAGFETLVLTVDMPVPANREHNIRNGFDVPLRPSARLVWQGATRPRWVLATLLRTLAQRGMPHFENMDAHRGPPVLSRAASRALGRRDALAWDSFALIRRLWPGHLVVKGLLNPADARIAREAGADGIIVSNHGGRQLDGAIAPLRALPAVAEAAGGLPVMLESGVRRGTDVLKARALGADFVFLGRPFLFAVAMEGEAGARHAIRLLADEIERDMALLGVADLAQMGPHLLHREPAHPATL